MESRKLLRNQLKGLTSRLSDSLTPHGLGSLAAKVASAAACSGRVCDQLLADSIFCAAQGGLRGCGVI